MLVAIVEANVDLECLDSNFFSLCGNGRGDTPLLLWDGRRDMAEASARSFGVRLGSTTAAALIGNIFES
jgi:hypothetical protein